MATLAATVTRICDDLSRPEAEIGASVEREILSAVEHYSSERFAFNERTLQFTISSTDTYALADIVTANANTEIAEILGVDRVRVYVSSRYITLEPIGYAVLQNLRDSPTLLSGNPDYWAVFNKSVVFESVPNQVLTGYVEGLVKLAELSATNTENAWLTDGRELIAARAAAMVCRKKLVDTELAGAYTSIEMDEFDRLQQKATKLTASGKLRGSW
jgi:hypothetical protein